MVGVNQARDSAHVAPIILVEVTLKNSGGTHYFSDRSITVAAQRYEDYISNSLTIGAQLERDTSAGKNADVNIVFKNQAYKTYDYLIEIGETYPFEGADVTIKEVYLLDDGTLSDVDTLFVGALDSPKGIDLLSFSCKAISSEYITQWKNRRG
jgi:hypothetical protein